MKNLSKTGEINKKEMTKILLHLWDAAKSDFYMLVSNRIHKENLFNDIATGVQHIYIIREMS